MIFTYNPHSGEKLNEYAKHSTSDCEIFIRQANSAFNSWRRESFSNRAEKIIKAADLLIERKEELAMLMALEMGKPIRQGFAEVEKCAYVCRYYAENAEEHLKDKLVKTEASKSYVHYNALGPVLAIMPWNFPLWQVFRFAAPALMAGNVGLLKHSSNTMGCALEIERIFLDAGIPESCFKSLIISGDQVSSIILNPGVAAVTLTGSTPVGAKVASIAGTVIKKTVMELGGSDPYIILEDADIRHAAKVCAAGRLINSGQSCIAAKRFIVMDSVKTEFEQALLDCMSEYKMGNPTMESTDIGPQARKDIQEEHHEQVESSIKFGARLLLGGEIPDGNGFYYPATILTDVEPGMPVYDEETFGPVAAIIPAKTEEEAIAKANDTLFGLGAAVFSQNIERAERIAREEIFAGSCFVNDNVKSDPRLPFGGIKMSGYGRELSEEGIKEFVNAKTIVVR